MKYLLINIKNFIRHETIIFLLCILCIFFSSIVVNFSFGFYHHLEQKKLDKENAEKSFVIRFADESRSKVTKGKLVDVLFGIDEEILKDCTIGMSARFEQYRSDNAAIDNSGLYLQLEFGIENGKITVSPRADEWVESGFIMEGSYFTAEQIENGEYVCIVPPQNYHVGDDEESMWYATFMLDSEGYSTIDGKRYKAIGTMEFGLAFIPWVPITTVDDDCFIGSVYFIYDDLITRNQYNVISKAVTDVYGDIAVVDELDIREADNQRFYNTLIILAVLLAVFSGIVLSLLYEYIILQRKKSLTIYRLCGISKKKAVMLYFLECFLLTVVVYGISALLYEYIVLPYLAKYFEYMTLSYSLKVYFELGAVYTVTVLCILMFIIRRQVRNNIADELREV